MKKIIASILFLSFVNSYAAEVCLAQYAAGIDHVLKGVASTIGDNEKIGNGEKSSDDLYTVSVKTVSNKAVPTLTETKTKKVVALTKSEPIPGLSMYATSSLKLYPSGVPGAMGDRRFIIIMCTEESNL